MLTAMNSPFVLDKKARVKKGHSAGEAGTVVRVCDLTGFIWLTFDSKAGDRAYRDYHFGPFSAGELEQISAQQKQEAA